MRYDVRGWAVWLVVTAVLIMVARNPLYTVVLLLAVQLVRTRHRQPDNRAFQLSLWRFGLLVITLSALFNMLMVPFGGTILFALPPNWPLIGGAVTLEAAVYGAANGLVLVALLAVFMAFNEIVPVADLVQLMPRALPDVGVVLLVALTYVPETQRHLQQVRDAQAIRGQEVHGLRQWRPLILPLLIGGLERALALAEAMVSRGYGAVQTSGSGVGMQAGLLIGLAAALGGWLAAQYVGWAGWLLLAAGVALVVALVWAQGQRSTKTVYRPRPWRLADTWLVVAGLSPAVVLFFVTKPQLAYTPYPILTWPPFSIIIGLALMLVALPAALPTKLSPDGEAAH
jgi:energy-coupling factor transport system permease protein